MGGQKAYEPFKQSTVINVDDGSAAVTSEPFLVGRGNTLDVQVTSLMTGILTVDYSDDAETWFPSGIVFNNPNDRQGDTDVGALWARAVWPGGGGGAAPLKVVMVSK